MQGKPRSHTDGPVSHVSHHIRTRKGPLYGGPRQGMKTLTELGFSGRDMPNVTSPPSPNRDTCPADRSAGSKTRKRYASNLPKTGLTAQRQTKPGWHATASPRRTKAQGWQGLRGSPQPLLMPGRVQHLSHLSSAPKIMVSFCMLEEGASAVQPKLMAVGGGGVSRRLHPEGFSCQKWGGVSGPWSKQMPLPGKAVLLRGLQPKSQSHYDKGTETGFCFSHIWGWHKTQALETGQNQQRPGQSTIFTE